MKIIESIKELFAPNTPNNWETVYSARCKINYSSFFHGVGKADCIVLIQVERNKNLARGRAHALGQKQTIDIAEICVGNPEAQEVCRREYISW